MQAATTAQLQRLTGEAFDAAYVAQYETAHAMVLNLHQTCAASCDEQPQSDRGGTDRHPAHRRTRSAKREAM